MTRALLVLACVMALVPRAADASDVESALEEARRLSRSGDYSGAIDLLEKKVLPQSEGENVEIRIAALELMGVSSDLTGDYAQATNAFLRRWVEVVAEGGSDTLPAVRESARVATLLTRVERFDEARAFWRLHLASADRGDLDSFIDKADAFYGIGRTYDEQEELGDAESWYVKALEKSPDGSMQRSIILTVYAALLERMDRDSEAEGMRDEANAIRASRPPLLAQ